MSHEILDNHFYKPSPLSALGEFLAKLSEADFPVAVKEIDKQYDVSTQKILMHNTASAELRGYQEAGMVGMTIADILESLDLKPEEKAKELEIIYQNDRIAIENNAQNTHTQTTLDAKGFIRIYQRIVTPVAGKLNQSIALCTISIEVTPYTNLLYLFKNYKKYYEKKSKAIEKCFHYLKLDQYFSIPLNCRELSTLLAMEQADQYKHIAPLLNLSPTTIASYVDAIKSKLKDSITLSMVLNELRIGRQWMAHRGV